MDIITVHNVFVALCTFAHFVCPTEDDTRMIIRFAITPMTLEIRRAFLCE
jgi:hypothetical protein